MVWYPFKARMPILDHVNYDGDLLIFPHDACPKSNNTSSDANTEKKFKIILSLLGSKQGRGSIGLDYRGLSHKATCFKLPCT